MKQLHGVPNLGCSESPWPACQGSPAHSIQAQRPLTDNASILRMHAHMHTIHRACKHTTHAHIPAQHTKLSQRSQQTDKAQELQLELLGPTTMAALFQGSSGPGPRSQASQIFSSQAWPLEPQAWFLRNLPLPTVPQVFTSECHCPQLPHASTLRPSDFQPCPESTGPRSLGPSTHLPHSLSCVPVLLDGCGVQGLCVKEWGREGTLLKLGRRELAFSPTISPGHLGGLCET